MAEPVKAVMRQKMLNFQTLDVEGRPVSDDHEYEADKLRHEFELVKSHIQFNDIAKRLKRVSEKPNKEGEEGNDDDGPYALQYGSTTIFLNII